VKHPEQHAAVARCHLMRLVSRRRDDGRPAFIRLVEAELTDDGESIMLNIGFGMCSFSEPDDDASNVVSIFIDREDGEEFDAKAVADGFAEVVRIMNDGFHVRH
jgi:hypothetical protein